LLHSGPILKFSEWGKIDFTLTPPLLLRAVRYSAEIFSMSIYPVIASFARTPIAKFCGSFQSLPATKLGSMAISGALSKLPEE
jgi:hypothetical protein